MRFEIKFRKMIKYHEYKAFGFLYAVSVATITKIAVYNCSNCNYDITYLSQRIISQNQKEQNSLIISNSSEIIKKLKFKSNYSNIMKQK